MKRSCLIFCLLSAAMVLSSSLRAATIYAATAAGGAGQLYTIDSSNGSVVQDIGPLNDGGGQNYGITGLAFHPVTGVLYGSVSNSNPVTRAQLVTIDRTTAAVTVIGPYNVGNAGVNPATMGDLAFDAAGNLFGVGTVGGPQLYSINITTGQATLVGASGLTSTTGGGLEFDDVGGLFGTPTASRFGTYDVGTGVYSDLANPVKPLGGAYSALTFDPATGNLFGLNTGAGSPPPTALVIIDRTTGAVTNLGSSVQALDAIAVLIPEPGATVSILVSGILFVSYRRRHG